MNRRRLIALAVVAMVACVIVVSFVWFRDDPLHAPARRAWKDRAITTIQQRLADVAWTTSEVDRFRPRSATQAMFGGWVGDELLVMRNGDWIVCQNVCAKEQATGVTRDLIIGRGSDGKWYYSTFHFCVGKCVLQVESQPASLAAFVDGYWLVQFDGKSDDALRKTWDGEPDYGEAKLRAKVVP